ncbi:unnamed protein product [Pleuronectes platessa]|uniref:Uncharacterized protein n=1 Tax=Pleuronectes platessa TaxID=8262 RepID=A0A9N7Z1K9_PLEPL|nr:unnamed protein product [Pleuronectes platessa]
MAAVFTDVPMKYECVRQRHTKTERVSEVDDINKKLIILPLATSEGLARAIHCSLPLLLLLIHLTLPIPRRPRVGQGEWRGWIRRCFEREGKETFCSPSRLAIDEAH